MNEPMVLLYRDLPEERRASMERYATALLEHMARVAPARAVGAAPLPPACRAGAAYRRYVAYPLLARRQRSALAHIADHGYADLARWHEPRRTIITCHDLVLLRDELRRMPGFPARARGRFLLLGIPQLRCAGQIIAVSESTRRDLIALLGVPAERISVVYLGVGSHFRPLPAAHLREVRRRYDLPNGRLVLHVGHTGFYKNIEGLLRAFAPLAALDEPVYLLRVGPPLDRRQQALATKLGIVDRIVAREQVAEADLPAIYGLADALCFPSLYEGFGWPVVEALACGTPVVTTNVAALPEAASDAALLAAPHDSAGLTRALTRLLTDSRLRDELRGRGLRHAQRFSWEQTTRATWQVYERALAALGHNPGVRYAD